MSNVLFLSLSMLVILSSIHLENDSEIGWNSYGKVQKVHRIISAPYMYAQMNVSYIVGEDLYTIYDEICFY